MLPLFVRRTAALVAMALVAACAAAPPGPSRGYERHLALPADVAAAVAAGAVRHLLPFADPVPQAAGAPVDVRADGSFAVVYERGGAGAWVPRASHRVDVPTDGGPLRLLHLTGPLVLPGWRGAATARVVVTVRGDGLRTTVTATAPPDVSAAAAQALDRAFALAADPTAGCAGLAEPNLAGLARRRSLAASGARLQAGEPARAEALLLQAVRLGAARADAHRLLADLAEAGGDLELARSCLFETLLRADDPLQRGEAARRLGDLAGPASERAAGFRARWRHGRDDAAATSAARLHTARRQAPDPALDYRLASILHRRGDDELASLACALLAREHAHGGGPTLARATPLRHGLDEFVRRVARGVEPIAAGVDGDEPAAVPGP